MAENKTAAKENRKGKKIKNIIALIVCLIIAFGMWVYVMNVDSPDHENVFDGVTVGITGTDSLAEHNLAIFSGYGVKVDVTLAGRKSVVGDLTSDDIVVTADVKSVESSGRYNIKLNVDTPAGCKLVGISQDTISVYVDESGQITVDLSEQFENSALPEGCFTGDITLPVDKVTVSGPLSMLNKIDSAVVVLDMANVSKTTTLHERILLADAAGAEVESPYIDYFPRDIDVEIPVLRTVKVPIEVQFKNGFLNYDNTTVSVNPAVIEVTGDSALVSKDDIIAPIVIDEKTALETGRYDSVVTLEADEGFDLTFRKVKLSVSLKTGWSIKEFTVSEDAITADGAKSGVDFTWKIEPMTVSLMGPNNILSEISDEDLSVVFDMSPYSDTNTGTVRAKADVRIESEFAADVLPVGQYFVSVTFR